MAFLPVYLMKNLGWFIGVVTIKETSLLLTMPMHIGKYKYFHLNLLLESK